MININNLAVYSFRIHRGNLASADVEKVLINSER